MHGHACSARHSRRQDAANAHSHASPTHPTHQPHTTQQNPRCNTKGTDPMADGLTDGTKPGPNPHHPASQPSQRTDPHSSSRTTLQRQQRTHQRLASASRSRHTTGVTDAPHQANDRTHTHARHDAHPPRPAHHSPTGQQPPRPPPPPRRADTDNRRRNHHARYQPRKTQQIQR